MTITTEDLIDWADRLDLAWLGGFIDGEGSFHFRRQAGRYTGTFNYYYPAIRLVNTDMPTLPVVQGILDRHGLEYMVDWRFPTNGNKPSWDLEARRGAKPMTRWLVALIPYLRTKRSQAEDILRFLQLRAADTSYRDYSPEESEIIHRITKKAVILPRKLYEHATECVRGHALTGDNVYLYKKQRQCRACRSLVSQEQAANRKEKRRLLREQANADGASQTTLASAE
jgi:hypothetical protein